MKKTKNVSSKYFKMHEKYFPFSIVDVIIRDDYGRFLLTKRIIPPYKNKWHFPGGVIEKNISMEKMVKIIVKKELNLWVEIEQFVGVYEIKSRNRHDISHAYLVHFLAGDIKLDFQSSVVKFYKSPPNNIIPIQRKMWYDAKSLNK